MSYLLRGMGGDQPGCTLAEFGVFKPQCWCLDHPALCSPDTYKAAIAWAYPGDIYAPLKPPPVVGAPEGNNPPVSSIDELLAAQMRAWQAQNAATMQETQGNLDAIDTSGTNWGLPSLSGPNWLLWGGLAVGVLVIGSVAIGDGSPRRYGR